jgi:hypothetical protein
MKDMPESDLKAMVLERLYVWRAAKPFGVLSIHEWLYPPSDTEN